MKFVWSAPLVTSRSVYYSEISHATTTPRVAHSQYRPVVRRWDTGKWYVSAGTSSDVDDSADIGPYDSLDEARIAAETLMLLKN